MVLKKIGEKTLDILVNGTQEGSFTQDREHEDYNVDISTNETGGTLKVKVGGQGNHGWSAENDGVAVVTICAAADEAKSGDNSYSLNGTTYTVPKSNYDNGVGYLFHQETHNVNEINSFSVSLDLYFVFESFTITFIGSSGINSSITVNGVNKQ